MGKKQKWPGICPIHIIMTFILSAIILLALIMIMGPSEKHTTTEKSIEVGGNLMNFRITTGNETTILFESGQGADSTQWTLIQDRLANTTNYTMISYDRAGFGKSGMATGEYSIRQEIVMLESGLRQLGVKGEVVYVAHSYGGFLAQAYAADNPAKVKALVLADPNTVCFNEEGGFSTLWKAPPYPNASAANQRVLLAYPQTVREMNAMPPYPKNIPIIVISSGEPPVGDMTNLWRDCHQKIIEGNPQGEFWLAVENTHNIPGENPALVVAAIKKAASGR